MGAAPAEASKTLARSLPKAVPHDNGGCAMPRSPALAEGTCGSAPPRPETLRRLPAPQDGREKPDVLCLQETHLKNPLNKLEKFLKNAYGMPSRRFFVVV
ncbi:UNVERIFIED_CONTAM: hypothetical protein K2H54_055778 [Gekko kuhli]